MSAYTNLLVIRNVDFSQLKQVLTVDFEMKCSHYMLQAIDKRVMLFYTDHDGNYCAIDPELLDIEINSEEEGKFTLLAKKSKYAKESITRCKHSGYDWLFHHKRVDVALYSETELKGFKVTNNYVTQHLALNIDSIPNSYDYVPFDLHSVDEDESSIFDRFRNHDGAKIYIEYTGKTFESADSLYKEYKKSEKTLYKEYKKSEAERLCEAAERSARNESGIDFLYKGDKNLKDAQEEVKAYAVEFTRPKEPPVSKEYVATITTKLDPERCTELIELLRNNGFLDITIKI